MVSGTVGIRFEMFFVVSHWLCLCREWHHAFLDQHWRSQWHTDKPPALKLHLQTRVDHLALGQIAVLEHHQSQQHRDRSI